MVTANASMKEELSSLKGDLSSLNIISDNVEAHDDHVTTEHQSQQQNFTLQLNNFPVYTCGGTGS